MSELRAGVARTFITPDEGTPLAGYADRLLGCAGVRDDLTATALVVGDGAGPPAALVSLDLLAIHEDVADRIAARVAETSGVPREGLFLACSHSHSAPVASVGPRTRPSQRRYVEGLVSKVVDMVRRAAEAPRPVELLSGRGALSIALNRRPDGPDGKAALAPNPDGPVDRDLLVLQLRGEDGRAVATVVNGACHPTILSPRHRLASAEWPGEMRRRVEEATEAPCLFLQGGTGDLNPDHGWGDDDPGALERLGRRAGEDALAALETLAPLGGTSVRADRRALALDLVPERGLFGRPLGHRAALWRHAHIPPGLSDALLDALYPWRARVRRDAEGRCRVPLEVGVLRLGDATIATLGCEPFHALGEQVKAASPASATLFAGYTNGMIGYVAPAEEQARGGYEIDVGPYLYRLPGRLAPDSGGRATAASADLLESLWADAR